MFRLKWRGVVDSFVINHIAGINVGARSYFQKQAKKQQFSMDGGSFGAGTRVKQSLFLKYADYYEIHA